MTTKTCNIPRTQLFIRYGIGIVFGHHVCWPKGAEAYQLGNTSSRTISEVSNVEFLDGRLFKFGLSVAANP